MSTLKTFQEYQEQGTMRKCRINTERAKSLINSSERKMRSLNTNLKKVGITEDNANDYAEYCYDALMLLIRAALYLEGYFASGQGAHEAEVSYLRILGIPENDARFMNQLRFFRNGMLYYGTVIDKEYAEKVIGFTKKIYPVLKKKCEK